MLDGRIERGLTPERCARGCGQLLRPRRRGEPSPPAAVAPDMTASHLPAPRPEDPVDRAGGAALAASCRASRRRARAARAARVHNIPPQLELVGDPPSLVDVRVRGSVGVLGRARGGELVAVLDLRSARPGRRLFHLLPERRRRARSASRWCRSRRPPCRSPSSRRPSDGARCARRRRRAGAGLRRRARHDDAGDGRGRRARRAPCRRSPKRSTEPVVIAGAHGPVRDTVTIGVPDPIVRLRDPQSGLVTVEVAPAPVEWALDRRARRPARTGAGRRATLRPPTASRDRARRGPGGRWARGRRSVERLVGPVRARAGRYNLAGALSSRRRMRPSRASSPRTLDGHDPLDGACRVVRH